MNVDSTGDDAPAAAPWTPSPPKRWGARTTLAVVGIAAVVAGLGGAAIYAATGHTGHTAFGPGGPGFGPPGGPGFGRPGGPGGPGGPAHVEAASGPALHGTFVVAAGTADSGTAAGTAPGAAATAPGAGGGRFVTILAQTGTVTAATPTSLTLRSADGFTQTYVTSADQPRRRVDDAVSIRATQAAPGAPATVTEVLDAPPGVPVR